MSGLRRLKTFLILLALTAVFAALLNRYELRRPSQETRERLDRTLLNLEPEAITAIEVSRSGETYRLERSGGQWRVDGYRADEEVVQSALDNSLLVAERIIDDASFDRAAAGLEDPLVRVVFWAGEEKHELLFGNPTAVGLGRYAVVRGDDRAAVVPPWLFARLDQPGEAFRAKRLWRPQAAVRGLRVSGPGGVIVEAVEEDGWRLKQPFEDRASQAALWEFFEALEGLEIREVFAEAPGFSPLWMVEITSADSALRLDFGPEIPGSAELIYAGRSDDPHRYAIEKAALLAALPNADALRSRQIFSFFTSDATRALIESDGARIELRRDGSEWRLEGYDRAADPDGVAVVLQTLADLEFDEVLSLDVPGEKPADAAQISVETAAGAQRLWVTRDEEGYVGLLPDRGLIVRLPEGIERVLHSSPADVLKDATGDGPDSATSDG